MSSYVCTLPQWLQDKAKKELNEDPALRAQSIQIIRDWMIQQPHLNGRTDDVFILRFLRVSKFSLERTKKRIDDFYTMRTAVSEWFTNRDVLNPKIMNLIESGLYIIPPGYDKEGRKVFINRMGTVDPSNININDYHKYEQIVGDVMLEDEQTQICGVCGIFDADGFSGAHLSHWSISVVKKQFKIWQECNPVRARLMNFYNESPIFANLFQMFKMFMSDKIKSRLQLHGRNQESLLNSVNPEVLPEEYGGTGGKQADMLALWKKEVVKRRKLFIEEEKYGVIEAKRPGKPKTKEDILGIDGSFRKLNID